VLVVEEMSPFLEDAVLALAARQGLKLEVLGKHSGHLPGVYEYEPKVIARAVHDALGLGPKPAALPDYPELPARPPSLCPGCSHRATYFAARAAFGPEQLYFNDIGCYTLGYGPPLHTADALLCMGAGFTLAAGVSRVTGQRTVGFLGDSTFFHAGMPPLLNAIKEDVSMVAVILDNQVTAMTGFQESPTVSLHDGKLARRVDIEAVVRALGAQHVEKLDPHDLPAAIAAFERARDNAGLSVVIAERPCPTFLARSAGPGARRTVYQVDPSRCRTCGREPCGLRCSQEPGEGFMRQMARSRALEIESDGANEAEAREQALRFDTGPDSLTYLPAADLEPEPSPAPPERAQVAPCAAECPLGLCIQGYAAHIAAGQYREALELITSRLPLPETVCRVCHHPCESACVRAEVDEPVAINDLKRFVTDWAARQDEQAYAPPCEPPNGLNVAVVGAGPCGLSAAHELCLRGYQVTLFDAHEKPGGLLRTAIPEFRLPNEVLERDIGRILSLGVRFEPGRRLGESLDLGELLDEGYGAIVLAIGAWQAAGLGVVQEGDGPDVPVVDALGYLVRARAGEPVHTGSRVVVVGGGNAAIDAARTALRSGAEQVVIAYRRRRQEMPALGGEIEAALAEGVDLHTQLQPLALVRGPGGGLRCVRTEPGPPDASGRRRPVPVPGSEAVLRADQIIAAIGQSVDPAPLEGGPALALQTNGSVRVALDTQQSSHPRIYAGGDLTGGPYTVTDAIAEGQRAAWAIDRDLRGKGDADRRMPPPRTGSWPGAEDDEPGHRRTRFDHGHRAVPPALDAAERIAGFGEVVGTLSEAQAQAEAARCMVCGHCANCRACIDLFGCPAFYIEDAQIRIDESLCNGCGVCAQFCPNDAIRPVEGGLG